VSAAAVVVVAVLVAAKKALCDSHKSSRLTPSKQA